jgi:hypothetical protein
MFETHLFAPGTSTIDTGTSFGSDARRTMPITFTFGLTRTAAAHTGAAIVLGSAARQIIATLSTSTLTVVAGGSLGGNQATAVAANITPAQDKRFDVTIAVYPNRGRVSVWREGQLLASAVSANGSFTGPWSDDDAAGSFGVALVGATVGPLTVYQGQVPFLRRI